MVPHFRETGVPEGRKGGHGNTVPVPADAGRFLPEVPAPQLWGTSEGEDLCGIPPASGHLPTTPVGAGRDG